MIVQIGEELHLPECIVNVLLLVGGVVDDYVAEGALVDFPEAAIGVGDAGGGSVAVVEEGELSKGPRGSG